jgi:predicted RecB family endonuclease
MTEVELAAKFVEYLSDFDLYFEVQVAGKIVDIVAVKKPIILAVEVKTSFSMTVISQAFYNRHLFHYTYVAVPKTDNRFAKYVCENYGIGVLEYDEKKKRVKETIVPKLYRKAFIAGIRLNDFNKLSVPGCKGGRYTPFKEMIKGIVIHLQRHDGELFKDIFANLQITYKTLSAFKAGMYKWTRKGVITEFYIEKGKLYLTK